MNHKTENLIINELKNTAFRTIYTACTRQQRARYTANQGNI